MARSFLEALDVASCGQVALALISLGLLEGVFGEEFRELGFEAILGFRTIGFNNENEAEQ